MTSKLAPAGNAALNVASSLTLLLLGAWSASAVASRGVSASYDAAHSDQQKVATPTPAHTIDTIQHDIADVSGGAGFKPSSDRAVDQALDAKGILEPLYEREGTPLQSNSGSSPAKLIQTDVHDIPPLASPEKAPKIEQPKIHNHVDSVTTKRPEISGVETRLPGVSDANDVRFRRQMYRTDI